MDRWTDAGCTENKEKTWCKSLILLRQKSRILRATFFLMVDRDDD